MLKGPRGRRTLDFSGKVTKLLTAGAVMGWEALLSSSGGLPGPEGGRQDLHPSIAGSSLALPAEPSVPGQRYLGKDEHPASIHPPTSAPRRTRSQRLGLSCNPQGTVRSQTPPMPPCHQHVPNKFLFLSLLNGDSGTAGDPGRKPVPCACWLLQQDEFKRRTGGI